MSPRQPSDQVTMREMMAMMEGLTKRVDEAAKDAREARDAALGLRERMSAENTQEQLAKLWAELKTVENAGRSDLVNAIARISTDGIAPLTGRVAALEAWRERADGAKGLVGWVGKYAPWSVSAVAAVYAYLHGGGKMP